MDSSLFVLHSSLKKKICVICEICERIKKIICERFLTNIRVSHFYSLPLWAIDKIILIKMAKIAQYDLEDKHNYIGFNHTQNGMKHLVNDEKGGVA